MKDGDLFASFCPVCHLMSHLSGADEHLINARKEFLLALRELIDRELERLEKKSGAKGRKKAKKVKLK
jgi:hypothetical protein